MAVRAAIQCRDGQTDGRAAGEEQWPSQERPQDFDF